MKKFLIILSSFTMIINVANTTANAHYHFPTHNNIHFYKERTIACPSKKELVGGALVALLSWPAAAVLKSSISIIHLIVLCICAIPFLQYFHYKSYESYASYETVDSEGYYPDKEHIMDKAYQKYRQTIKALYNFYQTVTQKDD